MSSAKWLLFRRDFNVLKQKPTHLLISELPREAHDMANKWFVYSIIARKQESKSVLMVTSCSTAGETR